LTSPSAENACCVAASKEDDLCLITNLPRYRCDHCIGADARTPAYSWNYPASLLAGGLGGGVPGSALLVGLD